MYTGIGYRDALRSHGLLKVVMLILHVLVRSSPQVMWRYDVIVGEWPGIAEDECSMCLCRDEESERVRISSSVRERSESGEERRVQDSALQALKVSNSE